MTKEEGRFIEQMRKWRQQDQSGVAPAAENGLDQAEPPSVHMAEAASPAYNKGRFSPEAYAFYRNLSRASTNTSAPHLILLECKSLPRSGLHYLNGTFARLLEKQYSFCEWYQEHDCCRTMPCNRLAQARSDEENAGSTLRLTKSHDLALSDPVYAPVYSARRVVLLRHPLYVLTSYFALEHLAQYTATLRENGINLEDVLRLHEPGAVSAAFRLVDECYVDPPPESLANWLDEKSSYLLAFVRKWAPHPGQGPRPFQYVVRYEEIDSFAAAIVSELAASSPCGVQERVATFIAKRDLFSPRGDPFTVSSGKLSDYLRRHAPLFEETAHRLLTASGADYLRFHYGT